MYRFTNSQGSFEWWAVEDVNNPNTFNEQTITTIIRRPEHADFTPAVRVRRALGKVANLPKDRRTFVHSPLTPFSLRALYLCATELTGFKLLRPGQSAATPHGWR